VRHDYHVTLHNDAEIERKRSGTVEIEAPVERVVEYGTYIAPSAAPQTRHRQGTGVTKSEGGTVTTRDGQELRYTKVYNMMATAYTSDGTPSNRRTAIGTYGRVGVIAVDPKVIPLRSRVYVVGANGLWYYGTAVAENTGGAVKGYIIDLFFNTRAEVRAFGRRSATVYILE
jgi:3D (Asp-Asp-Asp) domain-containing protein